MKKKTLIITASIVVLILWYLAYSKLFTKTIDLEISDYEGMLDQSLNMLP